MTDSSGEKEDMDRLAMWDGLLLKLQQQVKELEEQVEALQTVAGTEYGFRVKLQEQVEELEKKRKTEDRLRSILAHSH